MENLQANTINKANRKLELLEKRFVNPLMCSPPGVPANGESSAGGVARSPNVNSSSSETDGNTQVGVSSSNNNTNRGTPLTAPGCSNSNSRTASNNIRESERENKPQNVSEPVSDSFFNKSSSKRNLEPGCDNSKSKSPKVSKLEDHHEVMHDTGSQSCLDGGSRMDSGSRGAVNTVPMRSIKSYFTNTSGGDPLPATGASSEMHTASHTNRPKPISSTSNSGSTTMAPKSNPAPTASSHSSHQNISAQVVQDLRKQLDNLKSSRDLMESKASRCEHELRLANEYKESTDRLNEGLRDKLKSVYRDMAKQEARRKRDRLALDCVRLGKITFARMGPTSMQEVWEEGYALEELLVRKRKLYARKEELESRRKRLQNSKRAAKKGQGSSTVAAEEPDYHLFEMDLDLAAEAEAVRCHMDQLRRDEVAFAEEERLLESEKASHQKELKRCQSEERSRFYVSLPCLHERYQLLSLLGRGGFSEVWKALDLIDLREVAVKVHQLNPTWTEERKQQYIKHVTREYTIHRELKHPRVVQFFDVFEIDVNSFATVLQYCKGTDLDEKLKRQKTIPEKDAKLILMQIVSGLRYLNTPSPPAFGAASPGPTDGNNSNHGMGAGVDDNLGDRETRPNRRVIIHYDLKPGNILFDEMGDVKITDFGLSKIIDESNEGTSMELTSQGAGTYWYLPPECFSGGIDEPARISSKVDIWSLGVIFYQMLFGRRPFGEGKSQERVLSEGIILNATQVAFPNDPRAQKVSEEAKALIRDCLTHDQRFRPDIHQLSKHDYLKK